MECLTLKKSNCKNCYKCIRHCPVKSIRFSGNQAYIIGNECILCGQCFVVCPQNAKQIVDELSAWLREQGVEPEAQVLPMENSRARYFPTTGGILKTLSRENPSYTYMAVDGVENCIAALKDMQSGKLHRCFIEMSACVGGCIGGAGCLTHGEKSKAEVDKYGAQAYEKTIGAALAVLK